MVIMYDMAERGLIDTDIVKDIDTVMTTNSGN